MIIAQHGRKHSSHGVNIHERGTGAAAAFKGKPVAHLRQQPQRGQLGQSSLGNSVPIIWVSDLL